MFVDAFTINYSNAFLFLVSDVVRNTEHAEAFLMRKVTHFIPTKVQVLGVLPSRST